MQGSASFRNELHIPSVAATTSLKGAIVVPCTADGWAVSSPGDFDCQARRHCFPSYSPLVLAADRLTTPSLRRNSVVIIWKVLLFS